MIRDRIKISNIKNIACLEINFDFHNSNIIVLTGKNGVGKTTVVKAFNMITDIKTFEKSAGLSAIRENSSIVCDIGEHPPIAFKYNSKIGALDSKDTLPKGVVKAELPVPYGERFKRFASAAGNDAEYRISIATNNYSRADKLIDFFKSVYLGKSFDSLNETKIKKETCYFILLGNDHYIREDHFCSGEFFLIQLFRLITSKAELIIIDEVDIALDASAQVNLYAAMKPLLNEYNTRLIVISHSLAFMETVDDGGLYYLESSEVNVTLEQRSFGYIKSDLYGFKGRDRYILTEDEVLKGLLEYLINKYIDPFFEYEIIPIGGNDQVKTMAERNADCEIFGRAKTVMVVLDGDVFEATKRTFRPELQSKVYGLPVDDCELYIWRNKEEFFPDLQYPDYNFSDKQKKASKSYWKLLLGSDKVTPRYLYELIERADQEGFALLVEHLNAHLNL